ncbi:MAG: choice-of-anchor J domain-containing protein [Flavobacteriaceae bacterium]|nr:choice-of-anchor J domain-containing protein [Flavobacteriaceae bacterium]
MKKVLLLLCLLITSSYLLFAINTRWHIIKDIGSQKEEIINYNNSSVIKTKQVLATTSCTVLNLPFTEDFQTTSTTKTCWTTLDLNKDGTTYNNQWLTSYDWATSKDLMTFSSYTNKQDDWLITPPLKSNGKYIKIEYSIKGSVSSLNDLGVYLSTTSNTPADFTTTLKSKTSYKNENFSKITLITTVPNGTFYIGWHATSTASIYINNITIQEMDCAEPINFSATEISEQKATIKWEDQYNTSWEYSIQLAGSNLPSKGQTTTSTTNTVTQDNNGNTLQADTFYEFYVRGNCNNGITSEWAGPYIFKTTCLPLTILPFTESFDTNSPTYACWTIVNNTSSSKTWETSTTNPYKGDKCITLYNSNPPNDSWLISPTINLGNNKEKYELSFYYRTDSYTSGQYDLLLSTNGTKLSEFTTTIASTKPIKTDQYTKVTYYLPNLSGAVNFAWQIKNNESTRVYIDDVKLEKVDCIGFPIDDIKITNITSNSASFTWTDPNNQGWEYFSQPSYQPAPTISGSIINQNNVVVNKTNTNGGIALQPNTEYDFYIRSRCGTNSKGNWIGPIKFKTLCNAMNLPYWEGFNTDSPNKSCWTLINGKNPTAFNNKWDYTTTAFEGSHSIRYSGNAEAKETHDAWLISPSFTVLATKSYRLRYHYKTNTYNNNSFDVKLSTNGALVNNFNKTIQARKNTNLNSWKQETIIITGVTGTINIGWHLNGNDSSSELSIDNVFFEEVACPEPTELDVTNITKNSFDIKWFDDAGSQWEYVVQKAGGIVPTKNGTLTSSKTNNITKDFSGNPILPNTSYEFYVRSKCNGTPETYSEWMGPLTFRTLCDILPLPYWEGFNTDSKTLFCWSVINNNKNINNTTEKIKSWEINESDYNSYEGNSNMAYSLYDYNNEIESDSWLISPSFTFVSGKIYRIKYYYKTNSYNEDNRFEVLASNSGTAPANFKIELVKEKVYKNSDYELQKNFINNLSGVVNFAWHVKGKGSKSINIDNVFVEEVIGCPEPLNITIDNIGIKDVTVSWQDDFGAKEWEYYIQEVGGKTPIKNGVATTTKTTVIIKDGNGQNLKGNTDYELYVRTKCSNGSYSIWSDPINFTTLCDIYQTPFYEGFNKGQKQIRCWSMYDINGNLIETAYPWGTTTYDFYEGDQAIQFSKYNGTKTNPFDDWLISPTIKLNGGKYILKYHYKTSATVSYLNEFEVLLSTNGTKKSDFKTTLVPSKVTNLGAYKEQVVFIDNLIGDTNIAWHVNAKNTNYSYLYLDNIILEKVETCPEPYYVKVTGSTNNTITIQWDQIDNITSWEVIVVDLGQPSSATPVTTVNVTGNPTTTITGLTTGKNYTIFVRAKCPDGNSSSKWSTPINAGTLIGANDDCSGAINIPVATGFTCTQKIDGNLLGATLTAKPALPNCYSIMKSDVWFEFTAINTNHLLNISDLVSNNATQLTLNITLYDVDCNTINTTNSKECFSLTNTNTRRLIKNLIVGHKYLLRIGSNAVNADLLFKLCITTPKYMSIDITTHTVEQLIKEKLVISNCDLVSNVTFRTGTNYGAENGIAEFNVDSPYFPFKEGIILATNGVKYAPGPSGQTQGSDPYSWLGDPDLQKVLLANGQKDPNYNASIIEFDFIPIKNEMSFDFLFASEEYGGFQCGYSDVFAFLLTDLTTFEQKNLAVVPNSEIPVSVTTIRNKKYNNSCADMNVEYFGKYFDESIDQDYPKEFNAINYKGLTVPMTAKANVVPGRKYHIKLAIADYRDTSYNSAVFIKAGSFDIGSLDLGKDLLVETGNALCNGETQTIKSGLNPDSEIVTVKWYKDGIEMPGEIHPDLVVKESGKYRVTGYYKSIKCAIEGEVKVEIFPPIHIVVNKPENISTCRFVTQQTPIDLTSATQNMFNKPGTDKNNYTLTYFEDIELTKKITTPENYLVSKRENQKLYVQVQDKRTQCIETFEYAILFIEGEKPNNVDNVLVCNNYTLPALPSNQLYYTESEGKGTVYKGGDVLGVGKYDLFILQDNKNNCYEEVSFVVEVTEQPLLQRISDVVLSCDLYILPKALPNNKYFVEVNGKRVELTPGTTITQTNTKIYIVAKSENGICIEETSFIVNYEDCPIPKGFSPNGDGVNDTFDLSQHGATSIKIFNRLGSEVYSFTGNYTNQWNGKDKNGKDLPVGTYYYIIQAYEKTRTGWVEINK